MRSSGCRSWYLLESSIDTDATYSLMSKYLLLFWTWHYTTYKPVHLNTVVRMELLAGQVLHPVTQNSFARINQVAASADQIWSSTYAKQAVWLKQSSSVCADCITHRIHQSVWSRRTDKAGGAIPALPRCETAWGRAWWCRQCWTRAPRAQSPPWAPRLLLRPQPHRRCGPPPCRTAIASTKPSKLPSESHRTEIVESIEKANHVASDPGCVLRFNAQESR
jgi:hypothetical protein